MPQIPCEQCSIVTRRLLSVRDMKLTICCMRLRQLLIQPPAAATAAAAAAHLHRKIHSLYNHELLSWNAFTVSFLDSCLRIGLCVQSMWTHIVTPKLPSCCCPKRAGDQPPSFGDHFLR